MCLSWLDGDVSAACWKINYLQPLLRLQRAGKPFSPQSGGKVGGFEGEEGVQRRSRQSLGNPCVTCPDMPKPATYLWRLYSRGTWLHLKSLLSRIQMENKTGGAEALQNSACVGKEVWCDCVFFILPWGGVESLAALRTLTFYFYLLKKIS